MPPLSPGIEIPGERTSLTSMRPTPISSAQVLLPERGFLLEYLPDSKTTFWQEDGWAIMGLLRAEVWKQS